MHSYLLSGKIEKKDRKGFIMKTVKFLHCADLHLDSPMSGLKYLPEGIFTRLQKSTFNALSKITELALFHEVDFVVISGDIFDGEDRSLRAQAGFRKEMTRLHEKGINVYVIHGNHDHLGGTWTQMTWPKNVHIFGPDVEVKRFNKQNGTAVHLYGFSYPQRHVSESWIERYVKSSEADFHIGMLHGHFEGSSDHAKYAPFRLTDLLQKKFDYWALGHIHKREVLATEPPIVYPGNPQGRNRKETGIKGCYIVSLTEHSTDLNFQETSDVVWMERTLDGSLVTNLGSLFDLCQNAILDNRLEGKGVILNLKIDNLKQIEENRYDSEALEEIMETLREDERETEDFVWIRNIEVSLLNSYNRSQLAIQGEFFKELFTAVDRFETWEETLSPLYGHHIARKHLSKLTEVEKKNILEEAENKLLQLLSQE